MTRGQVYAGKAVILIEALDKVDQSLRTVENKFKKMGNNLSAMGRTAFTGGFFASIAQGTLINRFMKFDDAILTLRVKMGMLSRVSQQQEQQFAALEGRIRSLGKTTSFTAQQVAEGAVRLAQAGFSGKEIEDTLQSVLDLARGTGTDLANAATVLANTIRTYNLETEAANEITSMFVRATRQGTIEIDDLAESLKFASATAVTLGQSLPEVLAVFTLLSDKGMRGSISGTSLNSAFSNIVKKAEDIKEEFKFDLPVDTGGNLMFGQFLEDISRVTAEMTKIEKAKAFNMLFNLRANRSVLPIANQEDIDRLRYLVKNISAARDEARLAAIVMDSQLGGAFRRAVSAVDDLILSLGKLQSGPLMSILNSVPPIVNVLDQLITKYQGFTLALAATPAIALAAGAGMMTVGFAMKQVGTMAGGLRALGQMGAKAAGGTMIGKGINAAGKMKIPAGLASMGSRLGKFPTGAASKVKTASTPGTMGPMAYGDFQQVMGKKMAASAREVAVAEKAAAQAATLHKTAITGAVKEYQVLVATRQAEVVAATKNLANIKAANIGIARHNVLYKAQLATGQKIFNMEKELVKVQSAKAFWQQKLQQRAAGGAGTAATANAGAKVKGLIAAEKTLKSSLQARGMAMGKVLAGPVTPLSEAAAAARLTTTQQAAAGARTAASQRMAARVATANQTANASMAAKGAAKGKFARLQSISAGAKLSSGRGMAILPQVMSGLGKAGGLVKNIGAIAGGFAKLSMAVGKFVFSLNGVLLLFTFGDRIPVIKDALANLGSAFSAAFGQIFGIFEAIKPAFAYFMDSIALLSSQETSAVGFQGMVDSLSLMTSIVQGKLLAAWGAFKKELGWVWDTTKFLLGTMWELAQAVISIATTSIGNILGNTLDRLQMGFQNIMNIFTGGASSMSGADMFKSVIGGLANIVAELFNWVGYAIIQFNNFFYSFVETLEAALLRVVNHIPGVNTMLGEATVERNKAARMLRQEEDLQSNEKTMKAFRQNLDRLFQSNAFQEGSATMKQGLVQAAQAAATALRGRANMGIMAAQATTPQMAMQGGMPTPLAQQQQQMQETKNLLRGFATSLVGSAAGTRGNVTRSVSESELKKQTVILEDIRDESRLQNERSGNVFRR